VLAEEKQGGTLGAPDGEQVSFVRASALIFALFAFVCLLFAAAKPSFAGNKLWFGGAKLSFAGTKRKRKPPFCGYFAFQTSPFKALSVERRGGEGIVGD